MSNGPNDDVKSYVELRTITSRPSGTSEVMSNNNVKAKVMSYDDVKARYYIKTKDRCKAREREAYILLLLCI